jgi:hypothetical protein
LTFPEFFCILFVLKVRDTTEETKKDMKNIKAILNHDVSNWPIIKQIILLWHIDEWAFKRDVPPYCGG